MAISDVNQAIIDKITNFNFIDAIAWLILILLIIGSGFWGFMWWKNKKLYNKIIKVNEINGDYWEETYHDIAKNVKIGKGGFVILHLKKLKTWKIAYGGRTGKNIYEFYILPDGYWLNAVRSAKVSYINEEKGLIPILTTNPLMRGQYTSLEKQIDSLGETKKGFWENYGSWVMSIGFVLITGVMLWLIAKEIGSTTDGVAILLEKIGDLISQLNKLSANTQTGGADSGLVPAIVGIFLRRKK